jgi:ubiquitin-protein ligase
LTNIFALFYLGNPDSPYGIDRADEFRNNRPVYEEKIKKFTKKYASPMKKFEPCDKNRDWDFSI